MSPEDKIHRYLLLALGVVAGVCVFARGPSAGPLGRDDSAPLATSNREATRAELDAAIAELAGWIARSSRDPQTPAAANLRLLAVGRAGLAGDGVADDQPRAALVWANLAALSSSRPRLELAALPEPAAAADAADGDPLGTLAILLETGIVLDEPLPLPSGPTPARRLLETTLPRLAERGTTPDPWSLDLLAFAVLGGMKERRAELLRATLSCLLQLEREQRPLSGLQGDGVPAGAVFERLAAELEQRRAGRRGGRELQLSTSVFRAVAVLAEPDLEQRALRHLNALLYRYQLEREVYRRLISRARDEDERAALHIEALEALGRFEQALYGAHLAFRRGDRPTAAPRTAASMRRAASDLIDHLTALRESSRFSAAAGSAGELPSALLRAATHALRGLRAARIAT